MNLWRMLLDGPSSGGSGAIKWLLLPKMMRWPSRQQASIGTTLILLFNGCTYTMQSLILKRFVKNCRTRKNSSWIASSEPEKHGCVEQLRVMGKVLSNFFAITWSSCMLASCYVYDTGRKAWAGFKAHLNNCFLARPARSFLVSPLFWQPATLFLFSMLPRSGKTTRIEGMGISCHARGCVPVTMYGLTLASFTAVTLPLYLPVVRRSF